MRFLPLIFLLASCTYTDKDRNIAFGGRGAARGTGYAVAWDNVENMNNALIAGTVLGGGLISAGVSKAEEVTKRAADVNRSTEVINASNNAVKTAEIGAEVTKSTTLNPNVIPK